MFIAALFFQSSGSALSQHAPPECKEGQTAWEKRGTVLAVGMVSAYASMGPGVLLGMLHSRDFLTGELTKEERKSQLRAWRMRDRLIWIIGSLYCLICLAFTVLFLANVT